MRGPRLPRVSDWAARKALGAILALAGVVILLKNLPSWIWFTVVGAGLTWAGWAVFSQD